MDPAQPHTTPAPLPENRRASSSFSVQSLLILLAGLAWIWISRAPNDSTTQATIETPQVGFHAPNFSLADDTGAAISLADLRGHPVIVNLWASWCVPCRAEMPALERVHRDFAQHGLVLLGVNATSQDVRDDALAFAHSQGLTFPILFDENGDVARSYALQALPTTYFIDAGGIIRDVVIGGPMSETLLRIRVQLLLEQDASIPRGVE